MKRRKIIKSLRDRGFTGDIQLYFWATDGWYCDCNELKHEWLGQHAYHAIEQIESGLFDKFLTSDK